MRKFFLLLVMTGLTGCQTESRNVNSTPPQTNPPPSHTPATPATPVPADKRISTDSKLKVTFHIVKAGATEASAGFLKIQVDAENLTDSPKSFNYHIDWLDQNGTAIDLPEVSLPMSLMG